MLNEAPLISSDRVLFPCAASHSHGASITTATTESGKKTSLPSPTATAEVIIDTPRSHEHTNSVNRSYSDLDGAQFLFYAFVLCAARTAAQQPMNLALARKQTSSFYDGLSTRQVLQWVYRHEGGLRGWGQGMAAMTLGCAMSEVVYLFLFEYWRERMPLSGNAAKDAAAGYGADAMCRFIHIPLSIIAFRQMTAAATTTTIPSTSVGPRSPRCWSIPESPAGASSAWGTLRRMYSEKGMRTVFAGYGTTLAVGCQWSALWWALYGSFKGSLYSAAAPLLANGNNSHSHECQNLRKSSSSSSSTSGNTSSAGSRPSSGSSSSNRTESNASADSGIQDPPRRALPAWCLAKDDNVLINALASIAAGASTAVIFNPYMVIRTNLQTIPMATPRSATRHIYATRGIKGFYGGLWLNVSTCIIDGTLASTSYEYAKLWADKSRHAGSAGEVDIVVGYAAN